MDARTVHTSSDGARWFHLPPGGLADGPLEVKDLLGRVRRIDPAAAAPFEIDADRARDLSRQEIVAWLQRAEAGLGSVRALFDRNKPGTGDGLAGLQQVVDGIANRLRRPGDPETPIGAPADLADRLEQYAKDVLANPEKAESLRQVAGELQAAAARLKKT